MSLREIQARRFKKYARKAKEEKRKYLEENRAAAKSSFGAHNDEDNEQLCASTGSLRDLSKIPTEP